MNGCTASLKERDRRICEKYIITEAARVEDARESKMLNKEGGRWGARKPNL